MESNITLSEWWSDALHRNRFFIVIYKMKHRDERHLEMFGDEIIEVIPWEELDGY